MSVAPLSNIHLFHILSHTKVELRDLWFILELYSWSKQGVWAEEIIAFFTFGWSDFSWEEIEVGFFFFEDIGSF